jgi:hypothetical protein
VCVSHGGKAREKMEAERTGLPSLPAMNEVPVFFVWI